MSILTYDEVEGKLAVLALQDFAVDGLGFVRHGME
jgi:hypothetical protein